MTSQTRVLAVTAMMFMAGFADAQTPVRFLESLPSPPLDAGQAIERCPNDADTLLQAVIRNLEPRSDADSTNTDVALRKILAAKERLLKKHTTRLENAVRSIGEQLDADIQDCPKVVNLRNERVYDEQCVAEAEQRAKRARVAAVDEYLSFVHQEWPEFISSARSVLRSHPEQQWSVLLHVAREADSIAVLAAQFAR